MNPGTAINTLLKAASGVTTLVSTRIYPATIPAKKAYPAITYSELNQLYRYSKDGPESTGNHSFDVDIYAQTYAKAQEIATAVRAALDWQTGTVNTVAIDRIWYDDQTDQPYDEEKELFHITQTYNIRLA